MSSQYEVIALPQFWVPALETSQVSVDIPGHSEIIAFECGYQDSSPYFGLLEVHLGERCLLPRTVTKYGIDMKLLFNFLTRGRCLITGNRSELLRLFVFNRYPALTGLEAVFLVEMRKPTQS